MMTLDAAVQQPRTVWFLDFTDFYKVSCAKLDSTDGEPVEKAKLAFLDIYGLFV